MQIFAFIVDLIGLMILIGTIHNSQQRLRSFFYAIGAVVLVLVLGVIAIFILMQAQASVIDTNEVLDKVGLAVEFAVPIAAIWAASLPPSRVKQS